MKTNATKEQLNEALNFVNSKFDNNVMFKNFEQKSKNRIIFTLRVKDSSGAGAKISKQGWSGKTRKTISCCWHVHGYFFEYLFLKYPEVFIISRNTKMTNNSDNWQDINVGNFYYPVYYSDCCNCE